PCRVTAGTCSSRGRGAGFVPPRRKRRNRPACNPHRNAREGRRMTRIVVASGNAGKLAEFRRLLGDAGIDFVAQGELGVEDVEETGLSFVENALLKARHAARATGLPALADDSGLCVDALGGAPGLYSARYAGGHGDAQANIDKLLDALRGVPDERRGAHFHAAIVLLRHAQDPQPLIAEGSWH